MTANVRFGLTAVSRPEPEIGIGLHVRDDFTPDGGVVDVGGPHDLDGVGEFGMEGRFRNGATGHGRQARIKTQAR